MDGSLTPLNLKSSVRLPQTLILPAWVGKLGMQRRLIVNQRSLPLPRAVVEWMRADKRYAAWFEPEAAEVSAQAVDDSAPQTPDPNADDDDQPETPPEVETWSADQTVPVLRDYAARHGVELTKDDLKADIVAKLRAAGLPEAAEGE